ncbi:hypothetical protein V6N13_109624 [Hibiscus sabdariffa]
MTNKLCNEITSFRQEDDEAMHEAWDQYRDLFRRCPMHGLPEWTHNPEPSCYVGNYNRNVMSNTYNPTWKKHLNFSWRN